MLKPVFLLHRNYISVKKEQYFCFTENICYIETVYLLYRDRKLLAGLAGLPAWSGLGLSCLPRQQQQPAAGEIYSLYIAYIQV